MTDVSDYDNASRRAMFRMSMVFSSDIRSDEKGKVGGDLLNYRQIPVLRSGLMNKLPRTLRTVDKMVGSNLEQDVATYLLSSLLSIK